MSGFPADSPIESSSVDVPSAELPPTDLSPAQIDLPERLAKHTVRYADHRSVNWDDLTPMMRHYVEMKEQYPHALVLYRVGDFFETFFRMPLPLPASWNWC